MKAFLSKGKYAIIALCVAVVGAGAFLTFQFLNQDKGLILEGVSVSGIELGGMTKAEAKKEIDKHKDFAKDIVLTFDYEDVVFSVPASQIELKPDTEDSVDMAYAIGRKKDKEQNKEDIKRAKETGIELTMKINYNEDKLILAVGENLGDEITDPEPMKVEYGTDCLVVTNARAGTVLDIEKTTKSIEKELEDFSSDSSIGLKLKRYTPKNLTFYEFKEKYVKEAKNAVYTEENGSYHIEPETIGVEINEDEAKRIFEENKDSAEPYKIPAKITMPEVTAGYLEDKYVNKVMAKYSTSYAGSAWGRCQNIALAASKINGYVVNPGERFSYNKVVGPRTEAAGFKLAHVYVGTKTVEGIGGGICQVSSTLYNAVVMADLKTVSRTNHSIPVSYVPMGRDATVSYGTIDYVFENNKPYPISIKATTDGTILTVSIVGTSEMDYTVEFATKYISSVPYGEKHVEDAELAEGEMKVISEGSNGSVYESYRIYKRGGVEFDRKYEAKSRYQPVAKEIALGTKKADIPPETEKEQTTVKPEDADINGDVLPGEEQTGEDEDYEESLGDINDEIVHTEDDNIH